MASLDREPRSSGILNPGAQQVAQELFAHAEANFAAVDAEIREAHVEQVEAQSKLRAELDRRSPLIHQIRDSLVSSTKVPPNS